ncbi:hypothetical protein LOTGIDRAFT_121667, partial [Lottia gigantea]
SSEDEIDIILHGTPEQKRKLYKKTQNKRSNSSSEDDFEAEMNKELQETIEALENKRLSSNEEQSKENESSNKSDIQQFYDDIYFDSDEDEEKGLYSIISKAKKSSHPVVSNDDLLYDPDMDDEDQKWVDKQRKEYQPKSSNNKTKLPKTDAILNCPACMTTLCRDCQRHDTYANQYRAMFVTNCDINYSETLKYPKEQGKKKKRKKKKGSETESRTEEDEELYNPVKCSECQTVVAVYDKDEIYYFFNVLSSYS